VGAVIAMATWLALRDQQGLTRLSAVEQRLGNLEQQVAGGERDAGNRERMESRLIDLETAVAELSLTALSSQPRAASISPLEDEALQDQTSEQQRQLEAFASRIAELEESVSALREMPMKPSTVQSDSGGNAPEAKKVAGGEWVINLITVSRAEHAAQLLAKYRRLGIEAEQLEINRGGKRLYRLSVGGFPTRPKAEGYAAEARAKLELKETWVTRR
jgi:cell division septation protein DedD